MRAFQFHSKLDEQGVLSLSLPIGSAEANQEVVVKVEPLAQPSTRHAENGMSWDEFVSRTFGSCSALGLEEPPDLPIQSRD